MKILLVGSSGAGKTTFSRQLEAQLGLPVLHLDTLWHADDYSDEAAQRFTQNIQTFMSQQEDWVIDGNYNGSMDLRLAEADVVVWFQVPVWKALWRVIRRSLSFRKNRASRPEMPAAFSERFDKDYLDFLKFVWHFPKKNNPQIQEKLADFSGQVYIVKNQADCQQVLAQLKLTK